MRHLKALSLSMLSLLLLSTAARADETLTEKFSKTWPLAANGSLSLKNVNGNVTFEAWDRAEVQVDAEKKVRADDEAEARKILGQIRIDVQAGPSAVRIETKMPKREDRGFWDMLTGNNRSVGVSYRVKVPRGAIVETDNVNGNILLTGTRGTGRLETVNGNIKIEGTGGALVLESTNGNIEVTRAEGAVKASTTNGNIETELTRLAADKDLGFSTTNGGVTVRLPRDARLAVDAATTNGSIDSAFEVDGGQSTRKRLTGTINGGGARLHIRTTNGSVDIEQI
jgi:hypothetical protein